MDYKIDRANVNDKKEVNDLYKSLIGEEGCTWNEEYPNMQTIEQDIANNNLFCIRRDDNIIAVATLAKDIELKDEFKKYNNIYSITRVAVSKEYQRCGYAKKLLNEIIINAKRRGGDLIYLLVNSQNQRAKNLYKFFDFQFLKNIELHGIEWEILQKQL